MTREDDLKVGMWVAITHETPQDEAPHSPFGFGYPPPRNPQPNVDGCPLKIVAISFPFVAVTDGTNRFPIDVRETKVTKLDRKYVNAMTLPRRPGHPTAYCVDEPPPRTPEPLRDGLTCPLCQERLIERHRDSTWRLACRQCGFEGGLPPAKG